MSSKYLLQKFPKRGYGQLYLRTDALAKRNDMVPYDGPVPASMRVPLADGEITVAERVAPQYKTTMDGNQTFPANAESVPAAGAPVQPVVGQQAVPAVDAGTVAEFSEDASTEKIVELEPVEESAVSLIPKLTPEAKHAKLVEIISNVKRFPVGEDNFTEAGKPRIEALIMALDGADVSGAERDAAWAAVLKAQPERGQKDTKKDAN